MTTPGPGQGKEFCWNFASRPGVFKGFRPHLPILEGLTVCVSSVRTVAVGVCVCVVRTQVPCMLVAALQVRGSVDLRRLSVWPESHSYFHCHLTSCDLLRVHCPESSKKLGHRLLSGPHNCCSLVPFLFWSYVWCFKYRLLFVALISLCKLDRPSF